MTITALSGPLVVFGTVTTSSAGTGLLGQDLEHNEDRAPSFFDLGVAMADPRAAYAYDPGGAPTAVNLGFYNPGPAMVDYVPITANASAFVTTTIGSCLLTTLFPSTVAASSALGTYATTIIAPETGKVTGPLFAIDSTAAFTSLGAAGTLEMWNPGAGTGRCISVTTSSSNDGGTFSIAGRDMYGYKMTETLTVAQGTSGAAAGYTIKGQKAFKYISSITNTSTPTSSGVSIGFTDTFGFPLYVGYLGFNTQVRLLASAYSSVVMVALSSHGTAGGGSTGVGVVLGQSSIASQTSTTPDVRGIYASSTATNGTLRLQMMVTPAASAVASITSTNVAPFFGATQFSSV